MVVEYIWIEQFLVRGRPPGSDQPSGWNVILGTMANDRQFLSDPMTPEQAEAAGWPISRILEMINTTALKERDAALADKAIAEAERDAAILAKEAAKA